MALHFQLIVLYLIIYLFGNVLSDERSDPGPLNSEKCRYKSSGPWSECSPHGLRTKTKILSKGGLGCPQTQVITRHCPFKRVEIEYRQKGECLYKKTPEKGKCDINTNSRNLTFHLESGPPECSSTHVKTSPCKDKEPRESLNNMERGTEQGTHNLLRRQIEILESIEEHERESVHNQKIQTPLLKDIVDVFKMIG